MPASYNYPGIGSASSSATLTSASTVGGSPTQIQYNSGGGFAGISGSSVDISGNITVSGISTTTAAGTISTGLVRSANGTSVAVSYGFLGANTTGLYNNSGAPIMSVAGNVMQWASTRVNISKNTIIGDSTALTTTPLVTLQVSGTTYSTTISVTNYVNVGSPTTPPTCNAANKGNAFMNTTTNCLNYCDGTANRQVTSVAASCT